MISMIKKILLVITIVMPQFVGHAFAIENNDYVLGAGDLIKVVVFQNPEMTVDARVSESGTFSYPLLGEINVGGLTIRAAETKIEGLLQAGGYIKKPNVNIVLTQIIGNSVAVLGSVRNPGRYPLSTFNTHISELIASAGGVSSEAGSGTALLTGTRNGQPYRYELNVAGLMMEKGGVKDILVMNGDVVFVTAGNQVSIIGEVARPGRYALDGLKMNLIDVLAQAGGIVPGGSDSIVITGTRDNNAYKKEVDIPGLFIKNDAVTPEYIVAGDQIYVHRAPMYYIYGEAQKSGSYRVERNMTVIQALAQAGGLTGRGTQRNIKLHRFNSAGELQKLKPAMTDKIQPDDVLYVEESWF